MKKAADLKLEGTTLLGTGLGVAAIGVVGAAIGAACPLCVVAAPALMTGGIVQRVRAHFRKKEEGEPVSHQD